MDDAMFKEFSVKCKPTVYTYLLVPHCRLPLLSSIKTILKLTTIGVIWNKLEKG